MKDKKNQQIRAIAVAIAILVGLVALAVYAYKYSLDKWAEEGQREIQKDREKFEKELALNNLKAREKLNALSEKYKQAAADQQAQIGFEKIPSASGPGGPGIDRSIVRLPPLTPNQIQECMDFMKYRAQTNRPDGGGYRFEGDRDRALKTWDKAYKNNGCDATIERQLQMTQATQRAVQSFLRGN